MSPRSTEELMQIVQTAVEKGTTIGSYCSDNFEGIAIDLSKLDKIIEIDTENLVATIEPGVRFGVLAERLSKQGLRFIPADTPYYHDKTAGKLFYEGCSNISSLKYGSAKHFLMGSEVILPTGELLKTGGKTVKNVTGYDFTRFFNAPYTDFGITVKFQLKLLPLPEARKGAAVSFEGLEQSLAFVKDLKTSRLVPAYLLWIDEDVQRFFQGQGTGQLIIFEFDGIREEIEEQWQIVTAFIKKHGGSIAEAYEGTGETAAKWRVLFKSGDKFVLTDEYKMAFTRQAQFIDAFYALARQRRVKAGLFGQLSEGKLNIAFAGAKADPVFMEEINAAVKQAGGVTSGKYDRLTGKRRTGVIADLEARAKAAFDPKLILSGMIAQGVK